MPVVERGHAQESFVDPHKKSVPDDTTGQTGMSVTPRAENTFLVSAQFIRQIRAGLILNQENVFRVQLLNPFGGNPSD